MAFGTRFLFFTHAHSGNAMASADCFDYYRAGSTLMKHPLQMAITFDPNALCAPINCQQHLLHTKYDTQLIVRWSHLRQEINVCSSFPILLLPTTMAAAPQKLSQLEEDKVKLVNTGDEAKIFKRNWKEKYLSKYFSWSIQFKMNLNLNDFFPYLGAQDKKQQRAITLWK